jgi:hypothetical protein
MQTWWHIHVLMSIIGLMFISQKLIRSTLHFNTLHFLLLLAVFIAAYFTMYRTYFEQVMKSIIMRSSPLNCFKQ